MGTIKWRFIKPFYSASAYKTRTCKNLSVACHYTNLINALLIPQRIERRSHPYQKCALPIKLRNLNYINNNVKNV